VLLDHSRLRMGGREATGPVEIGKTGQDGRRREGFSVRSPGGREEMGARGYLDG